MPSDETPRLTSADERHLFVLTIVVAIALLLTLGVVSCVLWLRPGQNPIIMWVPIAILEWSFAGAMVSVLFRLAYRRRIHAVNFELYTWMVAKPFIGLFTGACVYFLALAGAKLLAQPIPPDAIATLLARAAPSSLEEIKELLTRPAVDQNALMWLNVIAFVGGFSDELSIGVITRFVHNRLGARAGDEEGRSSPKATE
jgi:hypothetical protein